MDENVGGRDRTARIVVGMLLVAALIGVGLLGGDLGTNVQGGLMIVLLVLAAIMLGTAGSRKCMVNRALGRNTYR